MIENSNPIFAATFLYFGQSSFFFILSKKRKVSIISEYKKGYPIIILGGIILTLTAIFQNFALSLQLTPYIASIMKLNILFSIMYGFFLFKEKRFKARLSGAVLMIIGAVVIILS